MSKRPSTDKQRGISFGDQRDDSGPIECLGKTFDSDHSRRKYFLELLREKLRDPKFRNTPGFPRGEDEDILRLSDPPYYTACPNPFLENFVRCYGRPYEPKEEYRREPFAVDVSVGKTDALYKAHGYHTKVPHLAIVPSILHYTKPGDLILDGFCGSGMTGVAAQWCASAPPAYRDELENDWKRDGIGKPAWGPRLVILGDLSPAATFITAGYNLPFDVEAFAIAAREILDDLESEIGWMYETLHSDGKTKGRIEYTVWSEIFTCPNCSRDLNFVEEALDEDTNRVREEFPCPHCGAIAKKEQMDLRFETLIDPANGETRRRPKRAPVLIRYRVDANTFEKKPDGADLLILDRINSLALPSNFPTVALPDCQMARVGRMATTETRAVHHMYLPRAAQSLAALWRRAEAQADTRLRNALLFFAEQAIWGMSVLNRYSPSHFSQVNRALSGVYYVASQHSEVSPWYILDGKLSRLLKAFAQAPAVAGEAGITTGDCAEIPISDNCIDYIFTDPPFGGNIYYADLNYLVESWHRVVTDAEPEAIVDVVRKKGTHEYQELMRRCFEAYFRALKPGRWMTVVFSNASNAIWRAIQEAMGTAGFVVADVRTLDKQQGSYRQVTSSAVKQDLVISAYKPTEALTERFRLGSATADGAWAFIAEHLGNLPVFVGQKDAGEIIAERTAHVLLDRMVAFHVQRGIEVPLSGPDFLAGLPRRFPERDGMYFLPEQVAAYDRKRTSVSELRQLTLFVTDEASAIQWVRQQLQKKPQTFQELQPQLMREVQSWAKHERTVELREILEQNFLVYDGKGPVPNQIHAYLSTNFRELRNRGKEELELREKGKDRWFVADPGKQSDLEKLREKALLREFSEYREGAQRRLKQFRTEALRAGFKVAYDARDYETIVEVAAKIPDNVLQEDEKLLMYYDVASMRLGKE